jgi:endonuclease/exonuclease/phosphatase family metal-dependent hydrolase
MVARFETPLGPMTVGNTHLSFVPGWNRVQLRRLLRDMRGFPGPRVLMGDLNLNAQAVARTSALRALGVAQTFPAEDPNRQLDHILTDDPTLQARQSSAPLLSISDHRPLVVDVSRA